MTNTQPHSNTYPQTINVTVQNADEHGLMLNLERAFIEELRDLREDVEIDHTRLWIAVRLKPRGGEKVYKFEHDPGALKSKRRRVEAREIGI